MQKKKKKGGAVVDVWVRRKKCVTAIFIPSIGVSDGTMREGVRDN